MKRVLVLLAAAAITMSCEKEEELACNCGTIANDGIDNECYWLEIRNFCSGNKKTFCVDETVWIDAPSWNRFLCNKLWELVNINRQDETRR